MYDPAVGKFLTIDPIEFESGQTNLYVYCADDPVNQTDLNGLEKISDFDLGKPDPKWHGNVDGGTIDVYDKATVKTALNANGQQAFSEDKDKTFAVFDYRNTGKCGNAHWLNLAKITVRTEKNTGGEKDTLYVKVDDKYVPSNEWRVDGSIGQPFLGNGASNDDESGAVDSPYAGDKARVIKAPGKDKDPETEEPVKDAYVTQEFDTYLISNGKPLWHVEWNAKEDLESGKIIFQITKSEAVGTTLPEALQKNAITFTGEAWKNTDFMVSCAPKMMPPARIDFPSVKGGKSYEEAVHGRADRRDLARGRIGRQDGRSSPASMASRSRPSMAGATSTAAWSRRRSGGCVNWKRKTPGSNASWPNAMSRSTSSRSSSKK